MPVRVIFGEGEEVKRVLAVCGHPNSPLTSPMSGSDGELTKGERDAE
jgi:hypothetical protein